MYSLLSYSLLGFWKYACSMMEQLVLKDTFNFSKPVLSYGTFYNLQTASLLLYKAGITSSQQHTAKTPSQLHVRKCN